MPMFDFRCLACNTTFERLVRGHDIGTCPACASDRLEKQVSAPAAPGQTQDLISRARKQAAREGHFSNYSKAERQRLKR